MISLLREYSNIFAWSYEDMPGLDTDIVQHLLPLKPECVPVKQKLRHDTTSRVLELLHRDLMGPMQMESLGGKKYAYVVVDDFSRYTWVNFMRENLMYLRYSKIFA